MFLVAQTVPNDASACKRPLSARARTKHCFARVAPAQLDVLWTIAPLAYGLAPWCSGRRGSPVFTTD